MGEHAEARAVSKALDDALARRRRASLCRDRRGADRFGRRRMLEHARGDTTVRKKQLQRTLQVRPSQERRCVAKLSTACVRAHVLSAQTLSSWRRRCCFHTGQLARRRGPQKRCSEGRWRAAAAPFARSARGHVARRADGRRLYCTVRRYVRTVRVGGPIKSLGFYLG